MDNSPQRAQRTLLGALEGRAEEGKGVSLVGPGLLITSPPLSSMKKKKKKEKQHSCASEGRQAVPLDLSASPSVRQGWGFFGAPFFFLPEGKREAMLSAPWQGCRGKVAMQGDNQEDKWKAHPGPGTKAGEIGREECGAEGVHTTLASNCERSPESTQCANLGCSSVEE